jgi:hypothetical protein
MGGILSATDIFLSSHWATRSLQPHKNAATMWLMDYPYRGEAVAQIETHCTDIPVIDDETACGVISRLEDA